MAPIGLKPDLTYQSVGEVYDEVETDVGQELLVDQFVDGSPPPEEDLVKTTKTAGVANISCVGDCHGVRQCWDWTDAVIVTSQPLQPVSNTGNN